ncbi:MAG: VWA domain-containing protein [Actinobacteria bacterium]|nr:VWA domain-containing protein [Actinomycetota bacterium]
MHLNTHLDFDLVALETDDEITVMIDLEAPSRADEDSERPAHTTVVVLDRSGSMHGDRLEAAKRGLIELVARLDDRDQFGVVVFDSQAAVAIPADTVGTHGRDQLRRRIAAIDVGGSTDLSSGYLRGLQEAKRVAGPTGATIVLLSDGHANSGETDPARLRALARNHADQRITTSTIGIGTGYDEAILAEVATGGSGNHSFARGPDEAAAAVAAEVDGLLGKTVQAASLLIAPTAEVSTIGVLNDLPATATADGVIIELGDFYGSEQRRVVVNLGVPAMAALGLAQVAEVTLTFVALPDLAEHTVTVPIAVNVVPGDVAAGRIAAPEVTQEKLLLAVQRSKREAEQALRRGDRDAARRALSDARSSLSEADLGASEALATETRWIDRTIGFMDDEVDLAGSPLAGAPPTSDSDYLSHRLAADRTQKSRGYRTRTQGGEVGEVPDSGSDNLE